MTGFRIFCGWDKRQAEAAEVFAFSVREHASIEVEINTIGVGHHVRPPLDVIDAGAGWTIPVMAEFKRGGVTAFSYVRFCVPTLCGWSGKALWLDGCDQLCLGDMAELAATSMDGYAVRVVKNPGPPGREREDRPRVWTSLMLFDCSAPEFRRWNTDYVEMAPDGHLMRLRDLADDRIGELPGAWNQLVDPGNEPPDGTKIAHWSALSDPDGGSWITRSGSTAWQSARQRWMATR
jgi:hypothetical protein